MLAITTVTVFNPFVINGRLATPAVIFVNAFISEFIAGLLVS